MHDASGTSTNGSGHGIANNVKDPVEAAQALFRRTLSNWVGDLLVLRQAGMLEMTWHGSGEAFDYRAAA